MSAAWLAPAFIAGGILADRARVYRTGAGRHRGAGRAPRTALNPPIHTRSIARGTVRIPAAPRM